jgi:hypothetical protein
MDFISVEQVELGYLKADILTLLHWHTPQRCLCCPGHGLCLCEVSRTRIPNICYLDSLTLAHSTKMSVSVMLVGLGYLTSVGTLHKDVCGALGMDSVSVRLVGLGYLTSVVLTLSP